MSVDSAFSERRVAQPDGSELGPFRPEMEEKASIAVRTAVVSGLAGGFAVASVASLGTAIAFALSGLLAGWQIALILAGFWGCLAVAVGAMAIHRRPTADVPVERSVGGSGRVGDSRSFGSRHIPSAAR